MHPCATGHRWPITRYTRATAPPGPRPDRSPPNWRTGAPRGAGRTPRRPVPAGRPHRTPTHLTARPVPRPPKPRPPTPPDAHCRVRAHTSGRPPRPPDAPLPVRPPRRRRAAPSPHAGARPHRPARRRRHPRRLQPHSRRIAPLRAVRGQRPPPTPPRLTGSGENATAPSVLTPRRDATDHPATSPPVPDGHTGLIPTPRVRSPEVTRPAERALAAPVPLKESARRPPPVAVRQAAATARCRTA